MWSSTEGTVVLIRLAEMYYVLAECAADAQTAAGYLNAVREARVLIHGFNGSYAFE